MSEQQSEPATPQTPPVTDVHSDGALRLTYAAIATRLGITTDAARQLARRRGWRRILGNHPGTPATIIVPPDELTGEQWRDDRPVNPPVERAVGKDATPPDNARLLAGALTVLEDAVSALREQLERSEIGRETALAKVDDLRVQITELGTELAVAKLFSEQAEAKAQEAAQAAEALRAADDARQAQGRWARLRAAWRGR